MGLHTVDHKMNVRERVIEKIGRGGGKARRGRFV